MWETFAQKFVGNFCKSAILYELSYVFDKILGLDHFSTFLPLGGGGLSRSQMLLIRGLKVYRQIVDHDPAAGLPYIPKYCYIRKGA